MTYKDSFGVDWYRWHSLLWLWPPSGPFIHGPVHGSKSVLCDFPLTRSLVVCLIGNGVGGGCRLGCGCCAPVVALLSAACSCWGSFTHTCLKKVSTVQKYSTLIYLFNRRDRYKGFTACIETLKRCEEEEILRWCFWSFVIRGDVLTADPFFCKGSFYFHRFWPCF